MKLKYAIVLTSDQHINSTVGLISPDCNLDDGNPVGLSDDQIWMWDCWKDLCAKVAEFKKAGGSQKPKVVWVFNGDVIELDSKNRTDQVFTRNTATMNEFAVNTLMPAWNVSDECIFIRGTQAHAGKSATVEETLAKDCSVVRKDKHRYSFWQWNADVCGIRISAKHHVNLGTRPWTEKNPLMALAYEASTWHNPPHLLIRGHCHRWGDTYDNFPTRVITTPAWKLVDEYVNERYNIDTFHVGAYVVLVYDGGRTEVKKISYSRKRFRDVCMYE